MASARVSIYWLLFEKKPIPATVEPTFSVIYGSNVDCNAKKLNTNTWMQKLSLRTRVAHADDCLNPMSGTK